MCGIIGIVGASPVQERLIESLKRLEYRGYDSAGVAGFTDQGIQRRRASGKLKNLEEVLAAEELMVTSATKEILPITSLDGKPVGGSEGPGPFYRNLFDAYQAAKAASVARGWPRS